MTNRKKELLSREDLELQWRPLYELHDRILFSKTEHLGLNWFPKYGYVFFFSPLLKASLRNAIKILFFYPFDLNGHVLFLSSSVKFCM